MAPPLSTDPHAETVDVSWLLRPRWGAVAAYLTALWLSGLGVIQHISAWPVLSAAAMTAASNLLLGQVRFERRMSGTVAGLLVFDIALLTAVLYLEGGASNPLSALYLVPIALCAVLLPGRWPYLLAGLTISAFGLLFFAPSLPDAASHGAMHARSPALAGSDEHGAIFGMHLRGMWVAFALTAISVAYFVTSVSLSLRQRERELSQARTRAMRAERVAALAGLAASAAHELGTPLNSITLAAGELSRNAERGADAALLRDDAKLVLTQARRCREILDAMLTEVGETVGETPRDVRVEELLDNALSLLPASDRPRVQVELSEPGATLHAPQRVLAQALHNLLRNALDASPADAEVHLRVLAKPQEIRFDVHDRGAGMNAMQAAEALEPFVSSKPGAGRGIGLFFASTVAERLGGELRLSSTPGEGTTASLEIARDARQVQLRERPEALANRAARASGSA